MKANDNRNSMLMASYHHTQSIAVPYFLARASPFSGLLSMGYLPMDLHLVILITLLVGGTLA